MNQTPSEAAPDWAAAAEERILDAALPRVGQFGWTSRLVAAAARAAGISEAEAELLLPHGARDLAALTSRRRDRAALASLAGVDPADLKIRERIRRAVLARCEAACADETVARRLAGYLALPTHVPLALRLTWESADLLWRWAGDRATDENHYSKRVLLSEILITTQAVRLALGPGRASEHLDGRIAAVMAFERWKAGRSPAGPAAKLAAALGARRYGAA